MIHDLYSLMHMAAAEGTPVLRPTFLEFENDARCFEDCDELLAGPFMLAAPLDRLPLVVPEGAILPMTEPAQSTASLHNDPSRVVRIFPGSGTGATRFVLIEDDGIAAGGSCTRINLDLSWTPERVLLQARAEGGYAVPATRIGVALPESDNRRLVL